MGSIAMEEYELMKDSKYRVYVSAVDKALKNFEYTSEWADLISALGKLNKVLLNYMKFPVIPRRIKISKRLAQCMHPALPSGVHLKALETYDIIFKCMGTNRLSHELFIYSAGLFPLLGHAAMNVRPFLLTVYETHFVPLGERLQPGLSGFLSGVLLGLEEGSDHFERTTSLLEKACEGVGPVHFYGCLWDCLAANSGIRLPAISYVLSHFNKKLTMEDQLYIMGTNIDVMVAALCACVQDSSVLVQRSALDLLLVGFPMHTSQLVRADTVRLVTAALVTILRRDMSLNRRLFAWLLGSEVNTGLLSAEHPLLKRPGATYFDMYSRDMLIQAIKITLSHSLGQSPLDVRPCRLLVSLLDKPDIGPVILDDILFEVFRALYLACEGAGAGTGEAREQRGSVAGGSPARSCQELLKAANLLFSSLEPCYIWLYMGSLLGCACRRPQPVQAAGPVRAVGGGPPNLAEVCALTEFLLDCVSLEAYLEAPAEHLPALFLNIISHLAGAWPQLGPDDLARVLRLCSKILTRVHPPALAAPPPVPTPAPTPAASPGGAAPELRPARSQSNVSALGVGGDSSEPGLEQRSKSTSDLPAVAVPAPPAAASRVKKLNAKLRLRPSRGSPSPVLLAVQPLDSEGPLPPPPPPDPPLDPPPATPPPVPPLQAPSRQQVLLAQCVQRYEELFAVLAGGQAVVLAPTALALFDQLLVTEPGPDPAAARTAHLEALLAGGGPDSAATAGPAPAPPAQLGPSFAPGWQRWEAPLRAACGLLVELSTFPSCCLPDGVAGGDDAGAEELPEWLRMLAALACGLAAAPGLQLAAAGTLLDLMALARAPAPAPSPATGGATPVVLVTLLKPWHLRVLEQHTCAVQVLARALWEHLGALGAPLQPACVELLHQLHAVLPTCDAVEDVIGEALAQEGAERRAQAFQRFALLWHLGRELEARAGPPRALRSFDRSLLQMLDQLGRPESCPLRLAAQAWLLHALLRGDVARLLEPLLQLLLAPGTARLSVLHARIHRSGPALAALTAAAPPAPAADRPDARIYAISSVDGNVIYHVSPVGRLGAGAGADPVRAKRIFAVTSLVGGAAARHYVTEKTQRAVELPASLLARRSISLFVNPFVGTGPDSAAEDGDGDPGSCSGSSAGPAASDGASCSSDGGGGSRSGSRSTEEADWAPADNGAADEPSGEAEGEEEPEESTAAEDFFGEGGAGDSEAGGTGVVRDILREVLDRVAEQCGGTGTEGPPAAVRPLAAAAAAATAASPGPATPPASAGVHPLHSHLLLYCGVYDSGRVLYALRTLRAVLLTHARMFVCATAATGLAAAPAGRASRAAGLQALLARHRKSVFGHGFHGDLAALAMGEFGPAYRSSMYLEVLVSVCLYFARSFYPNLGQMRLTAEEIAGNRRVQLASTELLMLLCSELIAVVRDSGRGFACYLADLLARCKVQKVALHCVLASVFDMACLAQAGDGVAPAQRTFTEEIVSFNDPSPERSDWRGQCPFRASDHSEGLQLQLLRLLLALVMLEHQVNLQKGEDVSPLPRDPKEPAVGGAGAGVGVGAGAGPGAGAARGSQHKYSAGLAISEQPMFLNAVLSALKAEHMRHLQQHWTALVTSALPFMGAALTPVVMSVVSQLCTNLEQLAHFYSGNGGSTAAEGAHETQCCLPPDYAVTQLEALTLLCHYCLLDSAQQQSHAFSQPLLGGAGGAGLGAPGAGPGQVFSNLVHVFMPSPLQQLVSIIEFCMGLRTSGIPSLVRPPQSAISVPAGAEEAATCSARLQEVERMGGAQDPLVSARLTVLAHLPRILASVAALWQAVLGSSEREQQGCVLGSARVVRQQLLELLSPISLHHGTHFLAAVAVAWQERRPAPSAGTPRKAVPAPGAQQQVLVALVGALRVLPMDRLVQTVHSVLKQPPAQQPLQPAPAPHTAQEQALEVSLLELFFCCLRGGGPGNGSNGSGGAQLAESWGSLLPLLRDGLTLSPPAQFLLLAVLSEYVHRCPPLAERKDQRDLQDITAKLVESCAQIAGACLEQTTWLRRNLAVREEEPGTSTGRERDSSGLSPAVGGGAAGSAPAQYSVQAQAVLAELLAPLLDVSYGSQEKEKVVALLTGLMYNVTPYLRNHTRRNVPSFQACSQLLASLSSYQYTRKAWRRDVFELLLDPALFQMEAHCLPLWRTIVDNLMTHDTTTFRDLMSRVSLAQSGSLSIFSSREQEYEQRAHLLKRLAFVLLCSETDQYHKYMPEIQERLADSLRLPQVVPAVQAQVFLCFRVLLLRMSPHHVTSLWPIIISELVQVFLHIEQELTADSEEFSSHIRLLSALDASWVVNSSNGLHAHGHPAWLQLQLAAAKLLDLGLALPAHRLPQFQMYRWAFVGGSEWPAVDNQTAEEPVRPADFVPHVARIARLMDAKFGGPVDPLPRLPAQLLLRSASIRTLQELHPFFTTLSARPAPTASPPPSPSPSPSPSLGPLEAAIETDFLERLPTK